MLRKGLTGLSIGVLITTFSGGAVAQITNEATVTATYGATSVNGSDDEAVDVVAGDPDLDIVKSVVALDISLGEADRADAGDTISYRVEITNSGNQTLTDAKPVDGGPGFGPELGRQAGTGTLSAFTVVGVDPPVSSITLAPSESATFEATYTLSDLDVYHAADTDGLAGADAQLAVNIASAEGQRPNGDLYEDDDESEARQEIPPFPEISLVKSAILNDEVIDDDVAEAGETIEYTYTVTNTGNVPLVDVSLADVHEGTSLTAGTDLGSETLLTEGPLATTTGAISSDNTANDGVWSLLQPEAVIEFTYVHTVTQQEVDGG